MIKGDVSVAAGRSSGIDDSKAVVIDLDELAVSVPYFTLKGASTIRARNSSWDAGAAAVDEYLRGSGYSVGQFVRLDEPWQVTFVPGSDSLGTNTLLPPKELWIWSASATGNPATLSLDAKTPVTLVVM
ncbi:MAG: hypothetical protein EXQ60_03730 [Candidatus Nanopelagicales bacterium]|nr:hypothetical protein [Candidatus Nanopelagicales bacterium]